MSEQYAVKAIVVKNNKFLLLKQSVDGKIFYTLPGGRITDSDEEKELKREVKEETGLDVHVNEYIGEWFFIRESDGTKTTCKTYTCSPISDSLDSDKSEDYEDIKEFIWVTKEDFIKGKYTENESLINVINGVNL